MANHVRSATVVGIGASLLALGLGASTAHAEVEKIFRLKNGRKIQGELVEETPGSYVVRTPSGGTATLSKDTVLKVEDAAPPGKQFLDPEKPTTSPPTANNATTPAVPQHAPTAIVSGPLASDREIDAAKQLLAAVPPPAKDRAGRAAHDAALDDIRGKVSLQALVALVSEPTTAATPEAPPERLGALEILAKAPPEKVRPLLCQAIVLVDLSKGVPKELLALTARVGPDESGTLEQAYLEKIVSLLSNGSPVDALEPTMESVGTKVSLPVLYTWLLGSETKRECLPAIGRLCAHLVSSTEDVDGALRPLAATLLQDVESAKLPHYRALTAAFEVLGDSKGEAAHSVGRCLERIEGRQPDDPKAASDWKECVTAGYATLSQIPSSVARDQLLRGLEAARSEERRLLVLGAIGRVHSNEGFPTADYLESLVRLMADRERTEAEVTAFSNVLALLTKKTYGTNVGAWQEYVRTLRSSGGSGR